MEHIPFAIDDRSHKQVWTRSVSIDHATRSPDLESSCGKLQYNQGFLLN